ncbi:SDR family NAD(P)-dependent oxidoreductase [Dyadobacter sp. CY356]|uniref:SDR family NAD(P)-dependent oxidoreductase n=1 Tax=Dyadobacter sp. CY356 TaxID=2906442 RepID=UPI001F387A7F|nr:SDR family NAD(P)-dependent oxidoreductase [Dyadobacter sp. CY356]MCF0055428.1 SDR family NAD(P)-dependent oxidoreductase [Dyadobacter sp. CY356]
MELIKTKFNFNSTADEVIEGIDLTGKRAIVTGGASGIGVETARSLAKAGAEVTLAVRNTEAGNSVAEEIKQTTGNPNIVVKHLDIADLLSVKTFVANWKGPLHILINNAGIMAVQQLEKTDDGNEIQFATNHLGHFALTLGLHNALKNAGTARVVNLSSSAHLMSPVVFDDINFAFRNYDAWAAYGQSKTAGILFSVGITEKWNQDGITSNALNPGAILTNLQRNVGGKLASAPELHKTPQQGAATSILLATSPILEGIGSHYFENCNEAMTISERQKIYEGVAPYALNKSNAERLWEISLDMLSKAGFLI